MTSDGWDRANDQNMGNKGNQDKPQGNGHRVVLCTASPENGELIAKSL
ncbi:MAG: Periplasmic divalent cation tolerance protein cuta [Euryarchaeota archaeon]|jgi:hypothetical protein|nr:Periplasmic divalent cation tolerance protein cuta [Euryarchaeota archaeon]